MHLHFERIQKPASFSDCPITDLSWMGKVPEVMIEIGEDEDWKLSKVNYYQDGWLATGNARGIVGVTYTTSRCKKTSNVDLPPRTNYNLRGHRSQVTLVKWNEPYQKLASCDSSGIIFVWIKYEGRWSIELINDRNTQVTDFSWSHDGRMALICYMDGFVLVGSVSGQRYWSSMLNLDSCTISCGIWTPDDQQVIFGTSSGHILVIDVHGTMIAQVNIQEGHAITSMSWNCEKFKMEDFEDDLEQSEMNSNQSFVLAVCFDDGNVYIMRNHDDIFPIIIRTGLSSVKMEWCNNGEMLVIAGHKIIDNTRGIFSYKNIIQLYTKSGILRLTHQIDYNAHPITALTWGHNDKRLFVATGPVLHIAWNTRRIASLELLSRMSIFRSLVDEEAVECLPIPGRLKNSISNLFGQTLQCFLPDLKRLRDFVSSPPGHVRLHCTMIRHDDDLVTGTTSYVLYLEYLGGLVPILKGKRASKLKPEFIIFDPQSEPNDLPEANVGQQMLNSPVHSCASPSRFSYRSYGSSPCATSSDSENEEVASSLNSPIRMRRRRRFRRHFRSRHSNNNANGSTDSASSQSSSLTYVDEMPENEKLVLVTSNIWGTKFKILGLCSWLPSQLGTINYRTSLLHLQPRQMSLAIKELGTPRSLGSLDSLLNNNSIETNNNFLSSDSEDEMAMSAQFDEEAGAPIAPMTPRKQFRCGSYGGQNVVSPERRSTIQMRTTSNIPTCSNANEYSRFVPSFTEEFLTLHLNGDSQLVSMEMTRDQSTSHRIQTQPAQSSISTQTSFQSISELINCLSFEKNTQTIFSPIDPQKLLLEQAEDTFSQMAKRYAPDLPCTSRTFVNPTNYHHINRYDSIPPPIISNMTSSEHLLHYPTSSPTVSPPKSLRYKITKKESPRKASISCLEPDLTRNCDTSTKNQSWFSPVSSSSSIPNWTSIGGVSVLHCANTNIAENFAFDSKSIYNDLKFIDDLDGDEEIQSRTSSSVILPKPNKSICHLQSNVNNTEFSPIRTNDGVSLERSQLMPNLSSQRRLVLKSSKQSHSFDMNDTPVHHSVRKCLSFNEEDEPNEKLVCKCQEGSNESIRVEACENYRLRSQLKTDQSDYKIAALSNSSAGHCNSECINPANYSFDEQLSVPQTPKRHPRQKTLFQELHSNGSRNRDPVDVACSPQHVYIASRHRSSLPQAISTATHPILSSANSIASSNCAVHQTIGNRSLPASPLSGHQPRRKAQGKGLLYSPKLLRKVVKQKLNYLDCSSESETSDDEDDRSEYHGLESFQKAHFRKKLAKKRAGRVQPEETPKPQPVAYREFVLHNKAPLWNEVSQVYQLDFGGRVTQESAKNFQIEHQGRQVMQFGRIDENAYTLDFQYPFSALQALAVALANVTQRLK